MLMGLWGSWRQAADVMGRDAVSETLWTKEDGFLGGSLSGFLLSFLRSHGEGDGGLMYDIDYGMGPAAQIVVECNYTGRVSAMNVSAVPWPGMGNYACRWRISGLFSPSTISTISAIFLVGNGGVSQCQLVAGRGSGVDSGALCRICWSCSMACSWVCLSVGDVVVGCDWRMFSLCCSNTACERKASEGWRWEREVERQVCARVEDRKPVVRCNLKLVVCTETIMTVQCTVQCAGAGAG